MMKVMIKCELLYPMRSYTGNTSGSSTEYVQELIQHVAGLWHSNKHREEWKRPLDVNPGM